MTDPIQDEADLNELKDDNPSVPPKPAKRLKKQVCPSRIKTPRSA
jgi:hypothetical protein